MIVLILGHVYLPYHFFQWPFILSLKSKVTYVLLCCPKMKQQINLHTPLKKKEDKFTYKIKMLEE